MGAATIATVTLGVIGCAGAGTSSTGTELPSRPSVGSPPSTTAKATPPITSTSTTAKAKHLTKAGYLAQANEVCKEGGERIRAAQQPFLRERGIKSKRAVSKKQSEEFIDETVAPGVAAQAQAIRALKPPAASEERAVALVQGLEAVAEAGERDPSSILREEPRGPLRKVNDTAKSLGATECTQP